MSRILLVEDDMALGSALEFTLSDEGYEVDRAENLQEAQSFFQRERYDIILLDVNLPDGNGYTFCKEVRSDSDIPIIFLTALNEEVNVVMGLELGANDYLAKPFGVRELLARIKVQLRSRQKKEGTVLVSDTVAADLSRMVVSKGASVLSLTALEYKLMVLFLQNPFSVLKREAILDAVSGSDGNYFDENTLSVYIKRLREKIEDDPQNPRFIVTKRGVGYQWNAEVKAE